MPPQRHEPKKKESIKKIHKKKKTPQKPKKKVEEESEVNPEANAKKPLFSRDRKWLLQQTTKTIEWDEEDVQRNSLFWTEERIRMDPQLKDHFELIPRVKEDEEVNGKRKPASVESGILPVDDIQEIYVPPESRRLLMPDLRPSMSNPIPVFSDLPLEDIGYIPKGLNFKYTNSNYILKEKEPKLTESKEFVENALNKNAIRCKCHIGGAVIPCYENPDCPCSNMNREMAELQWKRGDKVETKFTTFDPILFNSIKNEENGSFGFSCSNLCACKGKCTNNALMTVQKNSIPFEVYIRNKELGLEVRSNVFIRSGIVTMEFTGKIASESFNYNHGDYAWLITSEEDEIIKKIIKSNTDLSTGYRKVLNELYSMDIHIDPKFCGNVARLVNHSCLPNMRMARVFTKSLSPAHCHLVYVSTRDILPGEPLTVDYGHQYIQDQLMGKCLCGSSVCQAAAEVVEMEEVKPSIISSPPPPMEPVEEKQTGIWTLHPTKSSIKPLTIPTTITMEGKIRSMERKQEESGYASDLDGVITLD